MPRSALTALCVWLGLSASALVAQDRKEAPKPQPDKPVPAKEQLLALAVPGYQHYTVEGFDLLVHQEVLKHKNDRQYQRQPLDVLELELGIITRAVPPRSLKVLRKVVIWVEWEDKNDPHLKGGVVAKYYNAWGDKAISYVLTTGKHPWKVNNVEIINMHKVTEAHQPGAVIERSVILHELCHVVHSTVLGPDNPSIRAAYQQAMERRLYEESTDVLGRKVVPYARTNDAEYFAELSCAYLNKLYYYPHTRDELMIHDPLGYRLMELTWGTSKQLETVLKAEAEKAAARKLSAARKLYADGKEAEARAGLEKIVEYYPQTRSAPDAKALLKKIRP